MALSFSRLHLLLRDKAGLRLKKPDKNLSPGRRSLKGKCARRAVGSRSQKCSTRSLRPSLQSGVPLRANSMAELAIRVSSFFVRVGGCPGLDIFIGCLKNT